MRPHVLGAVKGGRRGVLTAKTPTSVTDAKIPEKLEKLAVVGPSRQGGGVDTQFLRCDRAPCRLISATHDSPSPDSCRVPAPFDAIRTGCFGTGHRALRTLCRPISRVRDGH